MPKLNIKIQGAYPRVITLYFIITIKHTSLEG